MTNCEALEPAACAVLSAAAYNYYAGGAEDETTLRANRPAFVQNLTSLVCSTLLAAQRLDSSSAITLQRTYFRLQGF